MLDLLSTAEEASMGVRDTRNALDENDPSFRDTRGVEITVTAGRAKVHIAARDGQLYVKADRIEDADAGTTSFAVDEGDGEAGLSEVAVISQINEA
ncbi:hypothetical protein ACIPYQ_11515 [Streptomyces sp. NPDC090045]|uniref:hypothetical protein n=1 Tax=Streptomyces sp. NPDC090045 TaxID=3365927 RepID=UPI0037F7E380